MITITTRMSVTKSPSCGAMRIYFHHEGETILDDLMRRHDRPHGWYHTLLPAVIREAQITINATGDRYEHDPQRTRWSQRAGCSCGCSPGFIVDLLVGYDLHVMVSSDTVFTADPYPSGTDVTIR